MCESHKPTLPQMPDAGTSLMGGVRPNATHESFMQNSRHFLLNMTRKKEAVHQLSNKRANNLWNFHEIY